MAVASSSQLSAEKVAQAEKWLTQVLEKEQRLVTFRELAREVRCHVHLAKNFLQHYWSTHPGVTPTYLLSGPLLVTSTLAQTQLTSQAEASGTQSLAHMSATQKIRIVDMDQMSDDERNSEADAEEERKEEEFEVATTKFENDEDAKMDAGEDVVAEEISRWGVVLVVGGESLEEKKQLFVDGQASIHIYSLTPAPIKDPAQVLISAFTLRERKDYRDPGVYGTILGDAVVAAPKAMRDGGMDFSAPKKTEKTDKADTAEKDPKGEVKEVKKEPVEAKKPRPSTKSKRRIITSDDEDEDEGEDSQPTAASSSKAEKPPVQQTSSMVRADDQAAMEAMMGMDVDDFDDEETGQPKVSAPASKPASKEKKRKRRQVKKSKVEMDDKGYMVTKDYFTDETCSGSDTETEDAPEVSARKDSGAKSVGAKSAQKSSASSVKPKETPRSASGSGGGGNKPTAAKPAPKKLGGQSTLAGFFTKK